jgi:hypothetical protein
MVDGFYLARRLEPGPLETSAVTRILHSVTRQIITVTDETP